MTAIRTLEPVALWASFADLNAVPRPSKNELRITQFMREFGQRLGLPTEVDGVGNVLIRKAATAGREGRPTVVLQSHLDMVWQKNADSSFDFDNQGIDMFVEGDWVKARGTTLGADNGIGVASIMAILASKDLEHPAIEALFTIDEETGMTGAKSLPAGWLQGRILLNLDTEEDHVLTIGCAGGVNVSGKLPVATQAAGKDSLGVKVSVRGLKGGHSGMEIVLGRANANKLMNRIAYEASKRFGFQLAAVQGGGLRNAIPRESFATGAISTKNRDAFAAWLGETSGVIREEYQLTDPDMRIDVEFLAAAPEKVLTASDQTKLFAIVDACPNGIFRMSPSIPGLVQSSNNLASVALKGDHVDFLCLTRSSVDSERDEVARVICSLFGALGATAETDSDYPGWQPLPDSSIVKLMAGLYKEMFSGEAHVEACHAGLECGIIGSHFPGMEMISFGPNITGAHSPDEKVQISSVQKFWRYLTETLKRV
jgi:dipeptidase D